MHIGTKYGTIYILVHLWHAGAPTCHLYPVTFSDQYLQQFLCY